MAWIVFGSFFLLDGHAPWWVWTAWSLAIAYDAWKEKVLFAHEQEKFRTLMRVLRSK